MDPAGLRPLGIGEVLDVAIKIYRSRFSVLIKAVTVVVAPVYALVALVQVSLPDTPGFVEETGQFGETPELEVGEFWTFLAGMLVVIALTYIASQLATAACFKSVSGAYLGEESGWRDSLQFARSKLGSLIWLSFVMAVLLVPAFLACIVPGIYFYVAWAVAAPVLLFEDRPGFKALKRSRGLVSGRWWATAGVLLLMNILTGIVTAVLSGLVIALVEVGENEVVTSVGEFIAQTTSAALITPFSAAVLTVLYFDLRVRKEGFDLELLAQRVGVEPPATPGDVLPRPLLPPPPPPGPEPPPYPPPRDG